MVRETITSQVHAIIKEQFCDGEEFTSRDIMARAPWIEEDYPRHNSKIGMTTRISAALSHLSNRGAIMLLKQCVSPSTHCITNYYISDDTIIDAWPGEQDRGYI